MIAGWHIQLMKFVSVGNAVPQAKSGAVNFIVTSARRSGMALLPDVPTIAEAGYPGFQAVSWFGLVGPAGMPADVVAKINAEVRKDLRRSGRPENVSRRAIFQNLRSPVRRRN